MVRYGWWSTQVRSQRNVSCWKSSDVESTCPALRLSLGCPVKGPVSGLTAPKWGRSRDLHHFSLHWGRLVLLPRTKNVLLLVVRDNSGNVSLSPGAPAACLTTTDTLLCISDLKLRFPYAEKYTWAVQSQVLRIKALGVKKPPFYNWFYLQVMRRLRESWKLFGLRFSHL